MLMESSYMDDADPVWYLKWAFGEDVTMGAKHVSVVLHDIFRNKVSGTRLLDIGCGPSLWIPIAAGTKFDHVVMADYNPKHHQYIKRWLAGDESDYNWNIYVDIFAELDSESDKVVYRNVVKRHMRQCIKDVCFADVSQPNPLGTDDVQQFDVVTAVYLFEALKRADMISSMTNAANLLKPGGTFVIVADIEATKFFSTNHEFMLSGTFRTLQDFETDITAAGLTIVQTEFRGNDEDHSNAKGTAVIRAEKQH